MRAHRYATTPKRASSTGAAASAWSLVLSPVAAILLACPSPAWAHASERAFVLLLPTGYYMAGGTLAVLASFLVLLAVPDRWMGALAPGKPWTELSATPGTRASAISAAFLLGLVLWGFAGPRDPLGNPLPLLVWTLFWGGLTIAQAVFGDLWAALNPWAAPYRLLRRSIGEPPLAYPAWLGYWPATLLFVGFAWFELVYPAPDDPDRLASAILAYSLMTLAGMLLFGERAWLGRGECFSVFFSFVAMLSPRQGRSLALPGARLTGQDPLPFGGVLFVLLTLATVSFDGLSKTFWWLSLGGINPLEYPGRTAVMARNSFGLVIAWAVLAGAYTLAILIGWRLAGGRADLRSCIGSLVLSILPISLAYHFAHYLTAFLVNAQYLPHALGWDGHAVTTSFLADLGAVHLLWTLQAGAVVLGHIFAVVLAHAIALQRFGGGRAAMLSQLPLALLMIGYTLFGLWLLAAPTAG